MGKNSAKYKARAAGAKKPRRSVSRFSLLIAEKLKAIDDGLTGRGARLREIYRVSFSEAETEEFVRITKKRNRQTAIATGLLIVIVALAGTRGGEGASPALDLSRPGAADFPKTIEAEVSAEYEGYTTSERARIRVLPREPSPEEAETLLDGLELRLPEQILGENVSLGEVVRNLSLPEMDRETGAEISWRSSDMRIISNTGEVNLIGIEAGTAVVLTAHIRLASSYRASYIGLKTGAAVPEGSMVDLLRDRMEEAIVIASDSRDGDALELPALTGDGVKIVWEPPEHNSGTAVIFGCALIAFIYFSQRYRAAKRNIEKACAEMERDYPDFIQKLGLLLGAGMVITSAIGRITDDYLSTRDIYGRRRLFEEIAAARERMRAAGTPLIYEFSELARRSGIRELMRFSTTLSDNIDKGSLLADKLRVENELLWESRKKRAEKKGRIAETQLIFPMALQIMAVIVITVMPAAFEMG